MRKRDYTPVHWDKYFEKMHDVKVRDNVSLLKYIPLYRSACWVKFSADNLFKMFFLIFSRKQVCF